MPRTQLNSLDMISILGLFSHSKLWTGPDARVSSWRLACDYSGGPKLVHYYYTALFIYFMPYKFVPPHIVLFKLWGTFACDPRMLQSSRRSLALSQESGLGPDPVSECHGIGYQGYYPRIDIGCHLFGVIAYPVTLISLPGILIGNSIVVRAMCFLSRPHALQPKPRTSDLLEFWHHKV